MIHIKHKPTKGGWIFRFLNTHWITYYNLINNFTDKLIYNSILLHFTHFGFNTLLCSSILGEICP